MEGQTTSHRQTKPDTPIRSLPTFVQPYSLYWYGVFSKRSPRMTSQEPSPGEPQSHHWIVLAKGVLRVVAASRFESTAGTKTKKQMKRSGENTNCFDHFP